MQHNLHLFLGDRLAKLLHWPNVQKADRDVDENPNDIQKKWVVVPAQRSKR